MKDAFTPWVFPLGVIKATKKSPNVIDSNFVLFVDDFPNKFFKARHDDMILYIVSYVNIDNIYH